MYNYSGHKNLEIVASRQRFNNWMYGQIASNLDGDILEVGSGLGVFSERIIDNIMHSEKTLTLTDSSIAYINDLRKRFVKQENIFFHKLDLDCEDDYEAVGYYRFDTIMVLNVIEHVRNDEYAFRQFHRMLRRNGMLIALVPSYKSLYNVIDRSIGHHRRYSKKEIRLMAENCSFLVQGIHYFNLAGILGWYLNGNVLRKADLSTHAFAIYDRLVPIWKCLDKLTLQRIGLSMICYLKKL